VGHQKGIIDRELELLHRLTFGGELGGKDAELLPPFGLAKEKGVRKEIRIGRWVKRKAALALGLEKNIGGDEEVSRGGGAPQRNNYK